MATGTAVVVVAALAAGAVGAGTVLLVSGPPAPLPAPSPAAAAPAPGVKGLEDLQRRLAAQEEAVAGLRASLEELRRADPLPPRGRPGGPPVPAETEDPADPSADPVEGGPEAEDGRMAGSRRTRAADSEAAIRARLERRTDLGLTADQTDGVVKALLEQSTRIRALFEEARTAGTADAVRLAQEKAAGVREETKRTLEGLLTADQMKALDSDQGRMAGRFGGRAGRFPRGAGGEGGTGPGPRPGGRPLPGGAGPR